MDSEKRLLLAVVLSMGVLWAYQALFAPSQSSEGEETREATEEKGGAPESSPSSPAALQPPTKEVPGSPSPESGEMSSSAPAIGVQTVSLEGKEWTGTFSNEGGGPTDVLLGRYDRPSRLAGIVDYVIGCVRGTCGNSPLSCSEEDPMDVFNRTQGSGIRSWFQDDIPSSTPPREEVTESGPGGVEFRRIEGNLEVVTSWKVPDQSQQGNRYRMNMSVTATNKGETPISVSPRVGVVDVVEYQDAGQYDLVRKPYGMVGGTLELFEPSKLDKKGRQTAEGPVTWVGMGDNYFLTVVAPQGEQGGSFIGGNLQNANGEPGHEYYSGTTLPSSSLPPGGVRKINLAVYMGPKDLEELKEAGMGLPDAVDFGWFGAFARPLLWLLRTLHGVVANWGLAIIFLTVIVKLAVFPLDQRSYKSMKAMQVLQPRINELRELYKEDREKMNLEVIQLYRQHQVNPLGGCLPILIQMPIWFALYRVLWHSIELYHSQFLYFCDLTQKDPTGALPLSLTVAMVLQQRMTPIPPGQDPAQAAVLRYMPLIFGVLMFPMPAGLVLYIFVSTVLRMAQQWYVQRGTTTPPTQEAAA